MELSVDFYMEHEENVPTIKGIGMLNQSCIYEEGVWHIFVGIIIIH